MKRILIALMAGALLSSCNFSFSVGTYEYANPEAYAIYEEPVSVSKDLTKISLDWVSGEITIKAGDSVSFSESDPYDSKLPLYYCVEGTELKIRFVKSGTDSNTAGNAKKKLELTLPSSFANLEMDTVSASSDISGISFQTLDIDTVSGKSTIASPSINSLTCDSVSGGVTANVDSVQKVDVGTVSGEFKADFGKAQEVSFDSVSGSMELKIRDSSELTKIDMDTTSGDANIALDGVKGYNLSFSSVSGKKELAFTEGSDLSLVKFNLGFSSVSGSLTVNKL